MEQYNRTTWVDRNVAPPGRYHLTQNGDGTVTLVPAPETIIEEGTMVTAGRLNNMEEGIVEVFGRTRLVDSETNKHYWLRVVNGELYLELIAE